MRIVIDMQGAQTESRYRGIGRYTLSFVQAIVRNRGEHEVILALNGLFPDTIEPIRTAFDDLLSQENIRVWYAPGPVKEESPTNDARRAVAELIREAFLASLQPDVIHITSLFEGYVDDAVTSIGRFDRATPVSVSLYDLIPLLNPGHYLKPNPRYARYYERKVRYLTNAASYLAISKFAREEGVQHVNVQEARFVNVSTAIELHFRPLHIDNEVAAQVRKKFGLTRPFLFYTGGADERKNLPRLIQAFSLLPDPVRVGHQLLLAGKISPRELENLMQHAHSAGLADDELRFTGYVTDEELVQLYNLCALFVFPSWHEGFGLPALEAMACGAPVIGANTSSVPEVIGLDEALFDPFSVASITEKIALVLEDESLRSALRVHALQQAKRFSWDESARRAIAAFEALAAERRCTSISTTSRSGKPRLAFVSPLPPERTGIADYSAELLPALTKHYDIDVIVAQDRIEEPWVEQHCKIRDVQWLRDHAQGIDRVVYQVGNSPFHQHMLPLIREIPGTVILHDFYLSGLMAWLELHAGAGGLWTEALYDSHGYGAVQERYRNPDAAKLKYPVNLPVLRYAKGVITHSEYSRNLIRNWYGPKLDVDSEVVPLLRSPAVEGSRTQARKELGLGSEDFVVCSFGFLDSTKLNDRLLDAWLASSLGADLRCKLVFVGENHGGAYGADLLRAIRASGVGDRISITGFAAPARFRSYLQAADMAVQLRTSSRGETSAAVLDCMNHALPVIVNANGSMTELSRDAIWMLQEKFSNAELVLALETLRYDPDRRTTMSQHARQVIQMQHSPDECARRYAQAIERFHDWPRAELPALIRAIVAQDDFVPTSVDCLRIAEAVSATLPLAQPAMRLFIDISATCRTQLKTGIERVARALLLALLEAPPKGFRIEPVYLSGGGSEWRFRYARRYTLGLLGCPTDGLEDDVVEARCGDVLLGLDLSGDLLVQADSAGLIADFRNRGVSVYYTVFDLLPVRMPLVFPPDADQSHARWLRTVAKFDGAICISKAVAEDLAAWVDEVGIRRTAQRPFRIDFFHLGADVSSSAPSAGLPEGADSTLREFGERPSFLMVGTIEPRKGYLETIDAFSQLWIEGIDVNLIIVGKEGWIGLPDNMRRDIPKTVDRIRTHYEFNRRLFWLEGISDEYLEKVYAASSCLVAASYGEGFGLPLIEAAQHNVPVIARDIPVFREVAGDCAFYFSGRDFRAICGAVRSWLTLSAEGCAPKPAQARRLTWAQSANRLSKCILGSQLA